MTRVARQIAAAIQTMRDACDQAERTATLADDRAVRRVLHELTWGLANASSSIEGALNAIEDERSVVAFAERKDAARYRFTRENWFQYFEPTRHWKLSTATGKTVHEGAADTYEAAVDAAMVASASFASA